MNNKELIDGIVECIKTEMPELRTVERYAGQFQSGAEKRVSFTCPAVFVASLAKRPNNSDQVDFGQVAVSSRIVFFCIADEGRRQKRTVTAEDIADQISVLGHGHNWNIDGLDEVRFESSENAFSPAFDKQGLGIWTVTFNQPVQLGESDWPPGEVIAVEAFLHDAPEIGETAPEYRESYDSIGEGHVRIEVGDLADGRD
ncbi:hypothetical protein QF117_10635 [Vibrio sp. YMD68]|uniref:hypothetical protein n=1 Tax=Vibrio sp. YMD68 TaxID=3042300 RepID=UPI00249CA2DD|nr:hypothetical protein [Vibrio sp. YMD68]WGV98827.1 hypothetical protein QF117_02375 [Vibrio sp. YMD68]WGW01246.1 hypothetical protein QF117_10635 [Vibrio sp. YMD68]